MQSRLESMRRDAKAAGAKSKQMLCQLEKAAKKDPEDIGLHELWQQWRQSVGPSTGQPRCGVFKWMQYEERWSARQGTRNELGRVLVTQKEFEDKMVAKGQTKEWARAEWQNRRASPEFKNGVCPDTNLPTVQMHEGPREIDFSEKAQEKSVARTTKAASANRQTLMEDIALVSRSVSDVTRATAFAPFKNTAADMGMEALCNQGTSSDF